MKLQKIIDRFRTIKIASAATVDEQGRPQSRIINLMDGFCSAGAVMRLHP